MNKLLTLLSLAMLIIVSTSCGSDDNNDEPVWAHAYSKTLVNRTVNTQANCVNYLSTADYIFMVKSDESTMSVVAKNISFDSHMPNVAFIMTGLKVNITDEKHITFSAANATVTDTLNNVNSHYNVTDVKGTIDTDNGVYTISYLVNSTFYVTATNSLIITKLADNSTDYTKATTTYYEYELNISKMTADLYIHNISFAKGMPSLSKIVIPGLTLQATISGYDFTGTDITPSYYNAAGQATPMDARKVTNFKSTTDLGTSTHTISFDCYGTTFTDTNKLYI